MAVILQRKRNFVLEESQVINSNKMRVLIRKGVGAFSPNLFPAMKEGRNRKGWKRGWGLEIELGNSTSFLFLVMTGFGFLSGGGRRLNERTKVLRTVFLSSEIIVLVLLKTILRVVIQFSVSLTCQGFKRVFKGLVLCAGIGVSFFRH